MFTEKTRSHPSSWADDTRKMNGHVGHGLASGRTSGGRARISNWWTERAPWRHAVPRQSAPVSPPPMITTCLPCGRDRHRVDGEVALLGPVAPGQVLHRLVDAGELAAGDRQVARGGGAAREDDGVELVRASCEAGTSTPTFVDGRNSVPSARIWSSRRSRWRFSILNSGMP